MKEVTTSQRNTERSRQCVLTKTEDGLRRTGRRDSNRQSAGETTLFYNKVNMVITEDDSDEAQKRNWERNPDQLMKMMMMIKKTMLMLMMKMTMLMMKRMKPQT